jgi:hypothetical protein
MPRYADHRRNRGSLADQLHRAAWGADLKAASADVDDAATGSRSGRRGSRGAP